MMLPNELIQNETEFKHLCSAHGKDVVKILLYIQKEWKEKVFTEKNERKQLALIYQANNLQTAIQEVIDANTATAPISTI
ncbi:hypothetical protein LQX96_004653 [Salmonella enterica]|nr:hypothetical protein [Salmonella enterica]